MYRSGSGMIHVNPSPRGPGLLFTCQNSLFSNILIRKTPNDDVRPCPGPGGEGSTCIVPDPERYMTWGLGDSTSHVRLWSRLACCRALAQGLHMYRSGSVTIHVKGWLGDHTSHVRFGGAAALPMFFGPGATEHLTWAGRQHEACVWYPSRCNRVAYFPDTLIWCNHR